MRYYATPSTPKVRDAMRNGHLGLIATPAQGNLIPPGVHWCADNGCFGTGYPGDDEFLTWLDAHKVKAADCGFVVAPDVVADAAATLKRSAPMLARIRSIGYPVALAAQDGLEWLHPPWDDFDVLFLGGTTPWKLGPDARALTTEARERGKPVHMGRVNSLRRLQYADHIGCTSADGTYLTFGPDINLPRLFAWLRAVNDQGGLWEAS